MSLLRGRVKGAAIRAALAWFSRHYGVDGVVRVHAALATDLHSALRLDKPGFGIIPSGWYDATGTTDLLEKMERIADPDDPAAYRDALTEAIAADHVGGLYRSLFRLIISPALLEANIQRIWRTYCDEGILVARAPRRGELHFELRGFTHHSPKLCEIIPLLLQHVLRGLGYEGMVLERTQCVDEGAASCCYEGMYLP